MIHSLYAPLSFLAIELSEQINLMKDFIHEPTRKVLDTLKSREQKINNEKVIIENMCYKQLSLTASASQREIDFLRATITIAGNLERIGDLCMNVASQMAYFEDANHDILFPEFSDDDYINELQTVNIEKKQYGVDKMFDVLSSRVADIVPAWIERSLATALPICRAEYELDELYRIEFARILKSFALKQSPGDSVTALFIYHYIERMGDQLLNIGEALMLAAIGEKIKIEQFETLQKALEQSGKVVSLEDLRYEGIWGTHSGCRIAKVATPRPEGVHTEGALLHELLHKDGEKSKLAREKKALDLWNEKFPDIAPKVLAYVEEEDRASLLMEFLVGCSLESVIVNLEIEDTYKALDAFHALMYEIRTKTIKYEPIRTDYTQQLVKRLDEVRLIHPSFLKRTLQADRFKTSSFFEVLDMCLHIESKLLAPFSVLIHGDCNANNILWNAATNQIHVIDLHRSRYYDYVQDVSIFLTSHFRQPIFDVDVRTHINNVIAYSLKNSKKYATDMNDYTFNARLALAMGRSLFTSTRFEMYEEFAVLMCKRAYAFIEALLSYAHQQRRETQDLSTVDWTDFVFPEDLLFITPEVLKSLTIEI